MNSNDGVHVLNDVQLLSSKYYIQHCIQLVFISFWVQVERLFRPFMDKRGAYILRNSNSENNALTISVV